MAKMMNEDMRMQRVEQFGSFLYCPARDVLCFGRYTNDECVYDSCILDDPEYQKLQRTIKENRMKRIEKEVKSDKPKSESDEWKEIHALEKKAQQLYRNNKPKLADGLMARAMYMRRMLVSQKERG